MLAGSNLGIAAPRIERILAGSTTPTARMTQSLSRSIRWRFSVTVAWSRLTANSCSTMRRSTDRPKIAKGGASVAMTPLEKRGAEAGLKLIQLDGNVGVLANGAGLTMTTMDVIRHYDGRPANFLEIGGEAYTKSEIALDLVLSNPGVKSLVINFCGAFARTDVMAEGVVKAWQKLKPKVPVFFSIHGTGEEDAVKLVRGELGIEPYDFMEDAIQAAVKAAQ